MAQLFPVNFGERPVLPQRRIADLLAKQSQQPRRIDHPLQGVSQLVQAAVAALLQNRAGKAETARDDATLENLQRIMNIPSTGVPSFNPEGAAVPLIDEQSQRDARVAQSFMDPGTVRFGMQLALQKQELSLADRVKEKRALSQAARPSEEEQRAKFELESEFADTPDILKPGVVDARIKVAQGSRAPKTPSSIVFDVFDKDNSLIRQITPDDPDFQKEIDDPNTRLVRTTVQAATVEGLIPTTTKTKSGLEEKLLGAREGLVRLKEIKSKYRPEFQEIPTRLGIAWEGLRARFGSEVSPENRQLVTDFADYRRGAFENINLYIKEITGKQMSGAEANRLRKAVPDPGETIFGGDDPITFESKMQSAITSAEKAAVRYRHYLTKGITDVEEMARRAPLEQIQIAVNPQTGERVVSIEGEWVPY